MGKLSRAADLSIPTIKRLYDEHYAANLYTLGKVAEALQVSIHELLDDDPPLDATE